MGDQPDGRLVAVDQDTPFQQMRLKRHAGAFRHTDEHHVGLNLVRRDVELRYCLQAFGKPQGIRMVVGKPIDMVVEGVDPGGRQNPDLAHATTDELADPVRLADHPL